MGGNLHKLPADPDTGVDNLHAVWDSVIYDYVGYADLPMTKESWGYFTSQSDKL